MGRKVQSIFTSGVTTTSNTIKSSLLFKGARTEASKEGSKEINKEGETYKFEYEGEHYQISMELFEEYIKSLYEHRTEKVQHLKDEIKKNFDDVRGLLLAASNSEIYEILENRIKEVFKDTSPGEIGTISSYLTGCHKGVFPSKNMNPACISGIHPKDIDELNKTFLVFDGNAFTKVNAIRTTDGVVYTELPFSGEKSVFALTKDQKKTLADYGLKQITVIYGKEGNYSGKIENLQIDAIPVRKDSGANNMQIFWTVAIIIVIIIVVLLVMYFASNK